MTSTPLAIRQGENGQKTSIPGLKSVEVTSVEHVGEVLQEGRKSKVCEKIFLKQISSLPQSLFTLTSEANLLLPLRKRFLLIFAVKHGNTLVIPFLNFA